MFGNSDAELVKGMKRGDGAAFASFVDQFGPIVLRLTRRYTNGCEADAEDLTQEIFVALCRGIDKFRGDAKLSTYVYRVAVNHCLKSLERSRGRGGDVRLDDIVASSGEGQDPQVQAAHGELAGQIRDALGTLSDGHRDVVILHEMHGLTYAECAAALGIPVGTVKSRLFHAFGYLRRRLEGYIRGEDEGAGAQTLSPPLKPQRSGEGVGGASVAAPATSIGKLL